MVLPRLLIALLLTTLTAAWTPRVAFAAEALRIQPASTKAVAAHVERRPAEPMPARHATGRFPPPLGALGFTAIAALVLLRGRVSPDRSRHTSPDRHAVLIHSEDARAGLNRSNAASDILEEDKHAASSS
ncbi:MAG: hypothetical protein QM777_12740 [Pseudorhodoferax sp.]